MRLLHALLLAALGGGGGVQGAIYISGNSTVTSNPTNNSIIAKDSAGDTISSDVFEFNTTINVAAAVNVDIEYLVSSTVVVDQLKIRTGTPSNSIDPNSSAVLTIQPAAFTGLTNMTSLVLNNIKFAQTNVSLTIPDKVAYLQVENTNAVDVSLAVENSSLNQVDFGNNSFATVPKCLYERNYSQGIMVSSLDISASTVYLNDTDYYKFKNNVEANNSNWFSFDCDTSTSSNTSSTGSGNSASANSSSDGSTGVQTPSTASPSTSSLGSHRMLASKTTVCIASSSPSAVTESSKDQNHATSKSSSGDYTSSGTKQKSSSKSWIYILVAVCAVVLVVAAFVYQRKRKSIRKGNQLSTMGTSSLDDSINGASVNLIGKDEGTPAAGKLTFISGDDLLRNVRLEPSEVSLNKPIGSGRLFTGTYQSSKVIIKRAEAAVTETAVTKQLMAQAKLLAQLSHPNLVQLVGVAWVAGTDFAIVTEFVPKGNLRAVLTKSRADLTMRMKLNMCIDIAQALAYLHSADCSVYVQNLSTSKVLVADDFQCKVNLLACQSLSTPMVSKHNSVSDSYGTGDVAWLAPEIITRSAPLVPRAVNIYAFGVLMCEIFSDALPYQSLINEMGNTLSDVEIVQRIRRQQVVVPHENSQTYMSTPVKVRDMIDGCLSSTPLSRPSAEDIVKCLKAIRLDDDNAPQASS